MPRIWRAPGRVNWQLYDHPLKRQAIAELDEVFGLAIEWISRNVRPGEQPSQESLDAAFAALDRNLRRWAPLGAMDTEPLANVRLALARSFAPRRKTTRAV